VHAAQHYRLAHWREASERLNYRRFFDVTSLIGVRVERPEVFDATHARLLELVRTGDIDGLRIDHPDGLADPGGYLDRLAAATGRVWTVVEKILEHGEVLTGSWACDGTTGYDAVAAISSVLADPAGEKPLTEGYVEATGEEADFAAVVTRSKRQVVEQLFPAEVRRLVREWRSAEQAEPGGAASALATVPDEELTDAIAELLVQFDVYRAYPGDVASAQRVDAAVARGLESAAHLRATLEALRPVLHRQVADGQAFAVRFEQTTGPVMAKGVEDTAFYRYLRLTALNEVGGDPGRIGMPLADWHAHCTRLAAEWPRAMTTLSTHDTKRSEDVRARLLVLAEIPDDWAEALRRWRDAARPDEPDAATAYLFWQTLVGAHPISAQRLTAYLTKATREAKQHTSWTDPDDAYERRLATYVDGVLSDAALMSDVDAWVSEHLHASGASNSLSQKLLQLTMPGVPDVYQGQETWDFSLVDPDNRRPVDYNDREGALGRLRPGETAVAATDRKMLVTSTALRLRRDVPEAFASGYVPVNAAGSAADHAVAFVRGDGVVVVATRLPVGLQRRGGWRDTTLPLPAGAWVDVLTGRPATTELADLLRELPVALLVRGRG